MKDFKVICTLLIHYAIRKTPQTPCKKPVTPAKVTGPDQRRKNLKVFLSSQDTYHSEIRRRTVNIDVLHRFSSLCEKIVSMFPSLKGKSFTVSWKDREGTYITMSTDEELAEAVFHNQYSVAMNLKVVASFKSVPSSGAIHPDIFCYSCDEDVQGYRYKCLECENYDLCSSCHALDRHPDHDMLKITSPTKYPHQLLFLGWCKMWATMFGHTGKSEKKSKHYHSLYHIAKKATYSKQAGKYVKNAKITSKKQNGEFLQTIAQSVASFLNPLVSGVNLKAYVEHSESETETCDNKSKTKEPTNEKEVKKPKDSEMAPVNSAGKKCSKNTKSTVTGENTAVEEYSSEVNASNKVIDSAVSSKRGNEKGLSPCSSRSSDSGSSVCGNDDWTVINSGTPAFDVIASDKRVDTSTSRNCPGEIFIPKVQNTQAPKQNTDAPGSEIVELLTKMFGPGYQYDGSHLRSILDAEKGNIDDAMASIYPNAPCH